MSVRTGPGEIIELNEDVVSVGPKMTSLQKWRDYLRYGYSVRVVHIDPDLEKAAAWQEAPDAWRLLVAHDAVHGVRGPGAKVPRWLARPR